jgi:hypothetical protein
MTFSTNARTGWPVPSATSMCRNGHKKRRCSKGRATYSVLGKKSLSAKQNWRRRRRSRGLSTLVVKTSGHTHAFGSNPTPT